MRPNTIYWQTSFARKPFTSKYRAPRSRAPECCLLAYISCQTLFTSEYCAPGNWIFFSNYSTALNFGVLPLVEIDHVTRQCLSLAGAYQRIVPAFGNFAQNLALYNKNNRVLLPQALCVIGSLKVHTNLFVVNIKFARATYHTIVPSTEELYCLNGVRLGIINW